jgi:hypothetical protein
MDLNLSGTINNQLFNLTYTGVLNGELGEDITVSFLALVRLFKSSSNS